MENIIKVGQAGVINFNVWCEDNEGYIFREGVAEVKLPVVDNKWELDFTLELKLGGVTENAINKKEIHHIELRAAYQEKDPVTDKLIVRGVKHLFNVEPISIDDNTEKYAVEYWKAFIDGKKVKDIKFPWVQIL